MRSFLAACAVAVPMWFAIAPAGADSNTGNPGLKLVKTVPVPSVEGDFDHFGIDLKGNRLFLAAEEHHSLELFDLHTGEHLRSITGFDTPHSMVLLLDQNQIYVVDGGDGGAVRIMNATTYKIEKSIKLTDDADALAYDSAKHLLYVTNGGEEAHNDYSLITVIDTQKGERVNEFRFASTNLESMSLEKNGPLMYVNVRDKNQIAVFDRVAGKLQKTWQLQMLKHNTPLIVLEAEHRLLVAGRKPGRFEVIDTDSGKEMMALPAADDVDEMTYDPASKRIYLACGEGWIDVFQMKDADHFEELGRAKGQPGSKTGTLVPELHRFYAAAAHKGKSPAALLIYDVQ